MKCKCGRCSKTLLVNHTPSGLIELKLRGSVTDDNVIVDKDELLKEILNI